jgi:hypothetical protein
MSPVATARWALMEGEPQAQVGDPPPSLRVGMAVAVGLAGGAAFWVISLSAALLLSRVSGDPLVGWLADGQVALGICAQVIVASAVAYGARRLAAIQGIFAGLLCGLISAVAALAVTASTVGTAVLTSMESWIVLAFSQGFLLTLPASALGAVIGARVRRARRPAADSPALDPPGSHGGSRGLSTTVTYAIAAAAATLTIAALTVLAVSTGLQSRRDTVPGGVTPGSGSSQVRQYRAVVGEDIVNVDAAQKKLGPACASPDASVCRQALLAARSSIDAMSRDMSIMDPPTCLSQSDQDFRVGLAVARGGVQTAIDGIDENDRLKVTTGSREFNRGKAYLSKASGELLQSTC